MACVYSIDGGKTFIDEAAFKKYLSDNLESLVDEGDIDVGKIRTLPNAKTEEPSGKQKSLETRAFLGDNSPEVKAAIEKHGLTYEPQSQIHAAEIADAFIKDVGIEEAMRIVRSDMSIDGGVAAMVWSRAIEHIDNEIKRAKDPAVIQELIDTQAQLISDFGTRARSGAGRFISQLNYIYENSTFGYDLEYRKEQYKAANGGVLPKEVEEKMNALNAEMQEAKKQLAEAEEKVKKLEEQRAIDNIKESTEKAKSKVTYSEKAKKVANDFRKLKTTPPKFYDANGNEIKITKSGLGWNDIIELGAKTIEKTGEIADGVKAVIDALRDVDWYRALSDKDKEAVNSQIESHLTSEPTTTTNRLKIPYSMIRGFVEEGNTDIESLTKAVKEAIKDEYPDADDREVRDAITGYGKTFEPDPEPINAQIRKLKTMGRLISAIEDAKEKKRPLKSGKQRDAIEADERAKRKELRELMKNLPIDEATLESQLKTALDAAKSRVRNRIEDLNKEIDSNARIKKNPKSLEADDELIDLRNQLKEVLDRYDSKFGAERREEEILSMLDAAIKKVNEKIESNDLEFKKPQDKFTTEKIEEKRKILKEQKEVLDKMREDAGVIEQRKNQNRLNSVNRRIAEFERRIKEGDFSKKQRKQIIETDDVIKAKANLIRIKEEYDKLQYANELKNRSKQEKIVDSVIESWNILRALRATGELSFIGVQGLKIGLSHPKEALSAFKTMLSHLTSEKAANEWLHNIRAQEFYSRMKESKLALTEFDSKLNAREEQFLTGWVNIAYDLIGLAASKPIGAFKPNAGEKFFQTWKMANPMKAVERAGVGYLNTLRVLRYLDGETLLKGQGKTFQSHPEDYKKVADVVNTLTGRSSLGKQLEGNSKLLSFMFFSPRNWASILKQTILLPFWGASLRSKGEPLTKLSVAQKMVIGDYVKFVSATAAMATLVVAGYNQGKDDDDKDKATVDTDPTSSDFMKIRIGNTVIDPWGGWSQQIVYLSRVIQTMYNRDGKFWDLTGRQVENKLAPTTSLINRFVQSKSIGQDEYRDKFGKPYSFTEDLKENVYPIYWGTVRDIHKEQPTASALALDAYGFVGGGVNIYDKNKYKLTEEEKNNPQVVAFTNNPAYKNIMNQRIKDEALSLMAKKVKEIDKNKFLNKEEIKLKLKDAAENSIETAKAHKDIEDKLDAAKTKLESMISNNAKAEYLYNTFLSKKADGTPLTSTQKQVKLEKLKKEGLVDKEIEKILINKSK